MSKIKVIPDADGDYEVWLDCDGQNYTGLCLAANHNRVVAIQRALADLAEQTETLRGDLMRAIVAEYPR